MEREILFRGLPKYGKREWVYGFYNKYDTDFVCIRKEVSGYDGFDDFTVDPSTVGQFTGLLDKNGTKIFEGDKIKDVLTNAEYEVKFGFNQKLGFTGWYCESDFGRVLSLNGDEGSNTNRSIEVIGNIHEQNQ